MRHAQAGRFSATRFTRRAHASSRGPVFRGARRINAYSFDCLKMKRILTLAGFTMLGFASAALLYGLLTFGVLGAILSRSGGSSEAYMGEAFLIMMPVVLVLGSSLTGCLSHPYLRTRFSRIAVTPGLYLLLFVFVPSLIMPSPLMSSLEMNTIHIPSAFIAACIIGMGLLWFLSSWAGVELGCYVRSRRTHNRPSGSTRTRPRRAG